MQAVAAELSGYAVKIPLLLRIRKKSLKTVCFDASILKRLLNRRAASV
jgi:hypothetical protein